MGRLSPGQRRQCISSPRDKNQGAKACQDSDAEVDRPQEKQSSPSTTQTPLYRDG